MINNTIESPLDASDVMDEAAGRIHVALELIARIGEKRDFDGFGRAIAEEILRDVAGSLSATSAALAAVLPRTTKDGR